jgi:tetratricopeptide (TPR) repeat protein
MPDGYNSNAIADLYLKMGNAKHELGDFNDAIQVYNIALELTPNDYFAYRDRGISKLSLNKYEEALDDFNEAVNKNPNLFGAYNYRGIVKFLLKDKAGAKDDFLMAIKLGSENTYDLIDKYL